MIFKVKGRILLFNSKDHNSHAIQRVSQSIITLIIIVHNNNKVINYYPSPTNCNIVETHFNNLNSKIKEALLVKLQNKIMIKTKLDIRRKV